MDIKEYQEKAKRTLNNDLQFYEELSNLCMGLAGESGEVIDYIKKCMYHNHKLYKQDIIKELGDVMWYLTNIATFFNIPMDIILNENIKKLEERYPEGYSNEKSINRKEYK